MTAPAATGLARVIHGAAAARDIYDRLKERVTSLRRVNVRPALAAILVGENSASRIYLRNKTRACGELGVRSELHELPGDCPPRTLLATIEKLNADPAVHGIVVQLPLPRQLDASRVVQSVSPAKDVDGLTWHSLGALMAGQPVFEPCTPRAVMTLLDRASIEIDGRQAVVVGRSTIVGKPMALMLMARGATVTICHSRTPDLAAHTRRADILVVAAGRAGLVTGGMVKPGAAVIDVGINRLPGGGLAGDVDFASARPVAGCITPVPGGVGPVTVAVVIGNTVLAAERSVRPPAA
ncbi:MAG: bifunctional 5,10-methylenetetrahydrofolate dehydrogenase/5,10-methenyltetrahydrofolate cyclohydrolase [Burkholderiales bacterium]